MVECKLSVLAAALEGYRILARGWWALLRIVWLPMGILVVLDFWLADRWHEQIEGTAFARWEYDSDIGVLIQFDGVLAILLIGLITALWHRASVAGPKFLSIFGMLAAWKNVAALTTLWCCLIVITVSLSWFFASMIPVPTTEFVTELLLRKFGLESDPRLFRVLSDLILKGGPLLVALHISGRLGLMLWSRPTGGIDPLDRAWAVGRGNGWRIAAAIFLATVPVSITGSALMPLPDEIDGLLYFVLWPDIADLVQTLVGVSVLSAACGSLMPDDTGTPGGKQNTIPTLP